MIELISPVDISAQQALASEIANPPPQLVWEVPSKRMREFGIYAAEGPEPTPQPGDTVEFLFTEGQDVWLKQTIKNGILPIEWINGWTFRTNNLVPGSISKVNVGWVGDPIMTNPVTPGVFAQGTFKGFSPIHNFLSGKLVLQKNSGLDQNNVPAISTPQVASEWGWMPGDGNELDEAWAMCGTHPDKPYEHTSSTCGLGDDVRIPGTNEIIHLKSYLFEGPPYGNVSRKVITR
jgi:hypothetical protein